MITDRLTTIMLCLVASIMAAHAARAQATFADRAVKQLEGLWVTTDGSRIIEFAVRNNSAVFEDAVRPGVKIAGSYGPGSRGAAYVLKYAEKLSCAYNVNFPSQEKGNEMIMTLVRAEPREQAHQCIVGTLKRTR